MLERFEKSWHQNCFTRYQIKHILENSDIIVILGASDNPLRPSYLTEKLLENKGYKTLNIPYGQQEAMLNENTMVKHEDKTIAIFLKPNQQKKYYDYIMSMKPTRIIFNPGTENEELRLLAIHNNIRVLSGCTIALAMNSLLYKSL